ncbi:MAG: hypothetical protein EZS28_006172 [Streblomastix strix]|uniref:Uncharacterized protein n=1 Tax=Streblomastix strix TaxID=222440 RepID=A0A5J4WTJ5_9EUKA|nr:MAG: hypothetical protein EZS28_006172 [Streblomastix strix]
MKWSIYIVYIEFIFLFSFKISIEARSRSTGLLQQISTTLNAIACRMNAFTSAYVAPAAINPVIIAWIIVGPVYGGVITVLLMITTNKWLQYSELAGECFDIRCHYVLQKQLCEKLRASLWKNLGPSGESWLDLANEGSEYIHNSYNKIWNLVKIFIQDETVTQQDKEKMTAKNACEFGYIIDLFSRIGVQTKTMKASRIIPTLVVLLDNPKSILMNCGSRELSTYSS